jgi:hypothetical protein
MSLLAGMPQLVAQYPDNDETACAFFFSWRTEVRQICVLITSSLT